MASWLDSAATSNEFAVLPGENTADPDELEAIARRLMACVQQPVGVDEMLLEVGVSIGIARFPRDGEDPHSLLRSADLAMYAARKRTPAARCMRSRSIATRCASSACSASWGGGKKRVTTGKRGAAPEG
jgi:GGDEF domain-containing protein